MKPAAPTSAPAAARPWPRGPRGGLLGGHVREFAADPLAFLDRCTREHGDFVPLRFLHQKAVLLNDHDAIEAVLLTQSRRFRKVPGGGKSFVDRVFGQGLLTSEGPFWVRQRRLMQPTFHRQRVAAYAPVIVDYARELMAGWRDGETRELHGDLSGLAARVLIRALFGTEVPPEIGAFERLSLESMREMRARRGLLGFLRGLWPGDFSRRFHAMMDGLDGFIATQTTAHRAGQGDRGDILTMLLDARDDQGRGMTDAELRDELMTLIAAGLDTTVLAMTWSCHLLARHPAAAATLARELDTVLGDRPPTLADLERLRFTQAVLREAMRLYPPAWIVTREALEDVDLAGYRIPRGTMVLMSQWLKHRDGRVFPDPLAFRPERWLGETALPKFAYFPFGGGPRICIGSGLAMMEAPLGLATLAQQYAFEPVSTAPVVPWASITLHPEGGMPLRLRRRQAGS